MPDAKPPLAAAIEATLTALTVERGFATATTTRYRRLLDRLTDTLTGRLGRAPRLADCTRAAVRGWLGALSPGSRAQAVSALRALVRLAQRDGYRAEDPTAGLTGRRPPRRLPVVLTRAEVARLLDTPWPETPVGTRDRAIHELLYATGLRAHELTGLRLAQLDLDRRLVRVTGKGGRERIVPVGQPALRALEAYWPARRRFRPGWRRDGDRVFLTETGRPLTRARLGALVTARARAVGLARRVTPHLWRHTFATDLVEGGADLRDVQAMLGHADVRTTAIYTHVRPAHLRRLVRRTHPRATGGGPPEIRDAIDLTARAIRWWLERRPRETFGLKACWGPCRSLSTWPAMRAALDRLEGEGRLRRDPTRRACVYMVVRPRPGASADGRADVAA